MLAYGRIPIVSWLRAQANECWFTRSKSANGTTLGAYPSLEIGKLQELHAAEADKMPRKPGEPAAVNRNHSRSRGQERHT